MTLPLPDQLPPHSLPAERGILGCCFLDANQIDEATEKLTPNAFYDLRTRKVFEIISAMRAENQTVDLITVVQKLKDQNLAESIPLQFIGTLPDEVPSAANLSHYIEIVSDKHLRRRLIKTCTTALERAYEDNNVETLVGQVENALFGLETDQSTVYDSKALTPRLIDNMETRFNLCKAGKHSGLFTGFYGLDYYTDGLQFGEQSIIAARPSIGKTALALNILDGICLQDQVPSVFVTYEMSTEALTRRMFAARHSVDMRMMRTGEFTEGMMASFGSFTAKLSKSPLFMLDAVSGLDADQLTAKLRRLVRKHGIKFVIVDYIQKITAPTANEKRTYEIAQVSGILKSFAVHSGVALLTLAQLNRESEKAKDKNNPAGRKPRLTDIGDSGAIERDADFIGLLHRDRGASEACLYIAKQRDGELGAVDLTFLGQHSRFENPPLSVP